MGFPNPNSEDVFARFL